MLRTKLTKSVLLTIGLSTLMAASSYAKFEMNAMCVLSNSGGAQPEKFNPTKQEISQLKDIKDKKRLLENPTDVTDQDIKTKFRIASLSKILVTHWAMATLGPEYRFKSRIFVTPTNTKDNSCYLHLAGDGDIFMGKEMLQSIFTQIKPVLKNQKCETVAQLSFDENFVVPMYQNMFMIQHRESADFRGKDPVEFYGPLTTKKALTYFIKNLTSIPVKEVKAAKASEFYQYSKTVPTRSFSVKSRPLYMMVREFNAYSSNIPANILFERLGGAVKYREFIKSRLGFTQEKIDVKNGSGYPINKDKPERFDNQVSCDAFVRIVQDLDHILKSYKGAKNFQLADVMAVGGTEEYYATFKSLYSDPKYTNTLTAKTGSAIKAITFGGMLSTTEGPIFFAVFTSPQEYAELNNPRQYIRSLVGIMARRHQLKKFEYKQIGLMSPIDAEAKFVEDTANISLSLK